MSDKVRRTHLGDVFGARDLMIHIYLIYCGKTYVRIFTKLSEQFWYGTREPLVIFWDKLFCAWLGCFTFLKLSVAEVCSLGMLLVLEIKCMNLHTQYLINSKTLTQMLPYGCRHVANVLTSSIVIRWIVTLHFIARLDVESLRTAPAPKKERKKERKTVLIGGN